MNYSPDEIKQARLALGMNVTTFAKRIGVSRQTVHAWESKACESISSTCQQRLQQMLGARSTPACSAYPDLGMAIAKARLSAALFTLDARSHLSAIAKESSDQSLLDALSRAAEAAEKVARS